MITLDGILPVLTDSSLLGPLWLTAKVSVVAVPFCLLIGVPLGYLLGRGRSLLLDAADFLVSLPLVLPPIATGFFLLLLLGRHGPLGHPLKIATGIEIIFGFWGVALAACVAGLPLMVRPVKAAVGRETRRYAEVSAVLGQSELRTFFRVILPLMRRSVLAGTFLAWARSLGEVGVTLMLGGNIIGRTNTVSLEIYNAVFTGEYDRALVLAILLAVISLGLLAALRWIAPES